MNRTSTKLFMFHPSSFILHPSSFILHPYLRCTLQRLAQLIQPVGRAAA